MVKLKLKPGASQGSIKDFRKKDGIKPSKEKREKIHVDKDGVKVGDGKKVKANGKPAKDKTPIKEKAKKNNQKVIEQQAAKPELPKWLDKHMNADIGKRIGTAAAVGAGIGLVSSAMNKQDDDVLTTGERMVKYAALGVGASYGTEAVMNKMQITSKHLAQHDVSKAAKKAMDAAEETRWNKNMARKTGVATMIGLAAFGAATLIDAASGLEEQRKATAERNRAEQELVKKQAAESRRQDKMGYGYVDYGQIAIQQFEKRIGHYAMGNARFN